MTNAGRRGEIGPGEATSRAFLAPGVFAAVTGGDLVFLDTRADQYHCLGGAGACVTLERRRLIGPQGLTIMLAEAGMIASTVDTQVVTPPPALPTCSLVQNDVRWGLDDLCTFLSVENRVRKILEDLPLTAVLTLPGAAPAGVPDLVRIQRITSLFACWLPWVPRQGACLYRAAFLRSLLRRKGQDAVWVFGVRTWPFAAHCWLQVGDAVLDDDVDRVRRYTPIMAI